MTKYISLYIIIFLPFLLFSQSEEKLIVTDSITPNLVTKAPISNIVITTSVTETYVNEDLSLLSDDYYASQIDSLWFNVQNNSALNLENLIYTQKHRYF